MIDTQKYIRKPLYVDAVRVTQANFDEIAAWCQGEITQDDDGPGKPSKLYIKVRVHNPKNPRQTKAFVGDWLLYTERGYKVYTNKAFHASFDLVAELPYGTETPGEIADTQPPEGQQFIASSADVTAPLSEEAVAETVEAIKADEGAIAEVPVADTRQVITEEEQQAMDPDELRELLQSGEYVLAQDLAA